MVNLGFILPKFNSKRQKARGKTAFLIRITAMATALTLIPLPIKSSAVEEREESKQGTEAALETSPQESEPLRESEQETAGREETQPATEAASGEETGVMKESEQETTAKEETTQPSTTDPAESEGLKDTEQETFEKEETEKREETETKEPSATTSASKETEALKETEQPKEAEEKTDKGEKEEKPSREEASEIRRIIRSEVPAATEIKVPIYNYDVVNIVAPAKYAVALNPYELAVRTGEDEVSAEQVVSRNYGILNKSSTDKIVSVTFVVEDLNGGEIVFVDSAEEAWGADEDTYAVYLAAVPADDSGIWIDGESVDCDTTAAELSDVEMEGAMDSALPLGKGENTISFKLSKAVYDFEDDRELILEDEEEKDGEERRRLELLSLAPGEGGITAFSFIGAMNRRADWGKLLYGIKISAVYTYETATGEEEIVEGTRAVVRVE